jgi:tetratricopeptide (TPR) repeat protein
MGSMYATKAREALSEGQLNRAVDYLKKGLKRDPYWTEGHLLLGDLYLTKLDHPVYALVEYRKADKVLDDPPAEVRLRLAWAYLQRGFEDRARNLCEKINETDLPAELELVDESFNGLELLDEVHRKARGRVEGNPQKYFEKYQRHGMEHLECGNYFKAQKAFENALEHGENPEVKLGLARACFHRKKFSRALELTKEIQATVEEDDAHDLLEKIYNRLGLDGFQSSDIDEDASSGRADSDHKAS